MPLSPLDLTHGPATPERLNQALEQLALQDLAGNKERVEAVLRHSRFQRVYVEYFLAPNPFAFREQLPTNKLFLQQARNLGLDVDVLLQGIPDQGIDIALKPSDLTNNLISEFSQQTLLLYSTALARHLGEHLDHFPQFLAKRRVEDLLDGEGEFLEKTDKDIASQFLTKNELKRYYLFDPVLYRDHPALQFITERIHRETESRGQEIIRKERATILGEFTPFFIRFKERGTLTPEDLTGFGFDLSHRQDTKRLHTLLNGTASRLMQFAEEYIPGDVKNIMQGFLTPEFMDLADHHILPYHVPYIASRLKGEQVAKYFLRKELLPPDDVDFGNDAGSCIGVYEHDRNKPDDFMRRATDIPFYQLDLATVVFGIYQQLAGKKPQRVGILPSFATLNESECPVLLENSMDLSQAQNPLDRRELERLVHHATTYFNRFRRAAGFQRSAIGIGDFNSGKNYLSPECFDIPDYTREELVKLPDLSGEEDIEPPEFYSQVFTTSGFSKKGHWAYLKL